MVPATQNCTSQKHVFDIFSTAVSLYLYDHFPQTLYFDQSADVPNLLPESGWIKIGARPAMYPPPSSPKKSGRTKIAW